MSGAFSVLNGCSPHFAQSGDMFWAVIAPKPLEKPVPPDFDTVQIDYGPGLWSSIGNG
jgi:hypothetical protein